MADELPQDQSTDWQGNPPPAPTGPPPAWDEIKSTPEFAQLNPNEQITAFQHWRGVALNHASTLPGYDDKVPQEFNEAVNPEQQRLATAAQAFNTQHPELPGLAAQPTGPEGFWGTAGRALSSGLAPAIGTAAGAVVGGAGGALVTPELGGAGAIPGAIGLGVAGGLATEEAQKTLMGPEWYAYNKQQMDLNAKEHPVAHQLGTIVPFLISAWTGAPEAAAAKGLVGKVVTEESGRLAKFLGGAAERFITGGVGGGTRAGAVSGVEEQGQITPEAAAKGAGRGIATLGAVSLFPVAKTILRQSLKGVPDSVAMSVAGELYDHYTEGRPFDFKKVADETKGSVAPFVLQNALLGWLHGMPMRAKSGEAAPPEATTTKPEIEAAIVQRQKDLEAQKAQGTITPDQQKELDDHNALLGMTQGEAAPVTPQQTDEEKLKEAVTHNGVTIADAKVQGPEGVTAIQDKLGITREEAVARQAAARQRFGISQEIGTPPAPPAELPQESKDLVNKVNEGLAAGEQPAPPEVEQVSKDHAQMAEAIASGRVELGGGDLEHATLRDRLTQIKNDYQKYGKDFLDSAKYQLALRQGKEFTEDQLAAAQAHTSKPYATSAGYLADILEGKLSKDLPWVKAKPEAAPPEALPAPKPTEDERRNAEAHANTMTTELLQQELAKPDAGYHDIIQAELDRRANAPGTPGATPDIPAGRFKTPGEASTALRKAMTPQTLQERIDAKTEAENAKIKSIQDVEDKIPPDKPFPKNIIFKTRDRELAGKQAWLDHVQDPEKDFKLPDLQHDLGRDAGTALYKEMWGEGGKTKHTVPLDEARKEITEGAPTQAETPEETERTAPEFIQQPEAPIEAATTPHEKVLMDHGITDPKGALDRMNEIARKKGLPEMTMEDMATKLQQAEKMAKQAPSDTGLSSSGNVVRLESQLPVDPMRVLENTQHLDNIGALDPHDPIGSGLRGLAEKGTPIQRFVAKLLLGSGIDTTKIKLRFDDKMQQKALYDGQPYKGYFDIYLNRNAEHPGSSIYNALLHEAIHHVTAWKLRPGYVPNAHEAVAMQSLDRLLVRGRQAAWKEMFGKNATPEELAKFQKFLQNPHATVDLPTNVLFRLYDNYNKFYGLANSTELTAEITNPHLVDFFGRLPADPSIKGRAVHLLKQVRDMIMQLVAGRPVSESASIKQYFDSVAALTQEAPERLGNLDLNLRLARNAGLSPDEIDRIKKGMIPAGNRFLYSMAPYNAETNRLGDKHTLPKSGEIDETAFAKVGGVNKPLNKAEIALYKTIVPQAFQNGKVNVRTLDQGLRTRGPVIEMRKLGSWNATPEGRKIAQLRHEWFDNLPQNIQTRVNNFVSQYLHDPKFDQESFLDRAARDYVKGVATRTPEEIVTKENEFKDTAKQWAEAGRNPPPEDSVAKYGFVGPKSEEHMPGYVEGLIRIPTKKSGEMFEGQKLGPDERGNVLWKGEHYGDEDVNVVSTYRGYEVTLPNGEKAFNVIELQGDEAQRVKRESTRRAKLLDYKEKELAKNPDDKYLQGEIEGIRDLITRQEKTTHPLTQVYESLGLKAAIQHAKDIGATKIILPDAETTMMTEGHDKAASKGYTIETPEGSRLAGFDTKQKALDSLDAEGKAKLAAGKLVITEPGKVYQEKGMRLHYDQTLPSAMEKITGQKGQPVDLGTHKQAIAPYKGADVLPGETTAQAEARTRAALPIEGSPIFKNAEGTPKTNETGRAYDLVKTPDEFTLTDRLLLAAGLSPEELPKSKGMYASIMRDAGVPYVGNFLGTHEQMAKDAQEELAKNPNAAEERLKILADHKAVPSAEDFHLFRAKVSTLRQAEVAARIKGDIPAANAARAAEDNWMTQVYNKTAEAGKSLQAVQGALDINTGDFFDLRSYFKMVYGKDFTPAMEKDAQKIVQDTTQARVDTLKSDIKMGQEIAKTAEGTVKELGKAAEGTRLTSAEKKAAKAAGVETKKTTDGKDTGQLEFGFDYDPADAGKKLSQYLQARFEAKPFRPGQKNLTIREVGNIWKFIKDNYLQGTEYVRPDELVKQVSADLGLNDTRIIKEAIASPKTIRALSDARYAAQSQQRAITNATKAWFEQNSRGTALKWAANLWEAPRSLAVIGHVNPSLTHAGSLLFRPSRWGSEIPSIGQAFNASFFKSMTKWATGEGESSQVYHERLMQNVMNTVDNADGENMYAKLTRLGLAAKVGTLDDIGQYNTKLGKIGVAGNRGMDILKALRMDLGAKEYKVLKGKDWFNALDQDNKDDVLREMVSRINSETGTTTAGFTHLGDFLSGRGRGDWRTFLFAPKLEGARWQQMVIDPFRAAGLWMKAGSATPAEKYFRNKVTLRSAELAGTYLAALTANAAILHAVGSDDKVNFLDPTRSDWLAFKVNGQTVIAPSSFLAPLRIGLSVALAHVIPAENRQPYTDKIINYAMGKVTPTISDIVEIARAKQNYTGRPIEALQNLYEKAGVKFATPKTPKDPISLYEWAATKGPIPLSATVEGWYNAMVSQGSSPELAKTIIGASIALVSSVFAVHQHPTTPTKETNP